MSKRTRLFFAIATGVLVLGIGTGLVASYMGLSALPFTSGGTDELAYVPADARIVAVADVREILTSSLLQKFRELHPPPAPSEDGFEAQTGVNPETDIDRVVAAILPTDHDNQRPLMIARGRFNEVRIEGLVRDRGGRVEDDNGTRILVATDGGGQEMALAFAEPGLLVFGQGAAVRAALDAKRSTRNVTDNAELMALIADLGQSNAWAVGRFSAITDGGRLPQKVLDQLPPIDLFAASGQVSDELRATVRAEARDAAAAQNLRDVLRGFLALGRLQVGTNASVMALLNSVELAGDGNTVALSLTIPAEALDLLLQSGAARRQASRTGF